MLFFSSYLLLFVILLIREIGNYLSIDSKTDIFPIIVKILLYLILCILSIASIALFEKSYEFGSLKEKATISIKNISNGNQEIVSYLLTIVIPLIGDISSSISSNDWVNLITMIIIIFFILILYVNSNLVVVNPMLVFFGYSINKINFFYENNSQIEFEGVLLTKNDYDLKLIQKNTIVHEIDEHTFILQRV